MEDQEESQGLCTTNDKRKNAFKLKNSPKLKTTVFSSTQDNCILLNTRQYSLFHSRQCILFNTRQYSLFHSRQCILFNRRQSILFNSRQMHSLQCKTMHSLQHKTMYTPHLKTFCTTQD